MSASEAPPAAAAARASGERVWTVLELLRWTTEHFSAQGIDSARLDAECLLAHALDVERLRLYIDFDKPVNDAERGSFRELVRRRARELVDLRDGRIVSAAQGVNSERLEALIELAESALENAPAPA